MLSIVLHIVYSIVLYYVYYHIALLLLYILVYCVVSIYLYTYIAILLDTLYTLYKYNAIGGIYMDRYYYITYYISFCVVLLIPI